jgi:hypothetical protein
MRMNLPVETRPFLWGAAGGAIALAVVGFAWGGWTTGGKAESVASERANAAVVAALAPVCVERFRRGTDAPAQLEALRKADTWSQGDLVEKGGWAVAPGAKAPDQLSAISRACANLLATG